MPELKSVVFSHKEIAEALIRQTDIHEGWWGLYVEFGIAGANIAPSPEGDLTPAAIVPILKLGIQRFDKPNSLAIDASKANPKPKPKKKKANNK